ncbi:MAG: hypothetical protein K2H84_00895, partial [Paramuribaculum sp.]|nr:hypothetical protein [Paramuribaculum sp.]
SLSPSPNSSDGEGRLKPIDAANTKAVPEGEISKAPVIQPAPQSKAPVDSAPKVPGFVSGKAVSSAPRGTTLRLPNFSMRGGVGKSDTKQAQTSAENLRSKPFTQDDFAAAWNAYADAHPKEHILANSMRYSLPETSDNTNFEAKVTNIMQLEIMIEALPRITKWMRDALQNDGVTITASVSETENQARYTLNDRELLAKIIEEKPIMAAFIEKLKLVLS